MGRAQQALRSADGGVLCAGADGIAVISAITHAADRAAAVREWQALWRRSASENVNDL